MSYHPALQALSFDHRQMIAMIHKIHKALHGPPKELRANIDDLLSYWQENGTFHIWEEEAILLPILHYRTPISSNSHLQQMLDDHATIRDSFHNLSITFEAGDPLEADHLHFLGLTLLRHISLEEILVFPKLLKRLPEPDLAELAIRAKLFRKFMDLPHRRPDQAPLRRLDDYLSSPASP